MDELTALREFRSDPPGPSAAETAAARSRLLAAMSAGRSGQGHPAAPLRSPAGAALHHRRAVAGRQAVAAGRPGRRLWVPVAAAAAVMTAGIAVAAVAASGPRAALHQPAGPAAVTAAFVLHQAASAAASQAAGKGRFFVTESEYITPADNQDDPAFRTIWIGHGSTGRLVQLGLTASIPSPVPFGRSTLTWAQLQHLPTAAGPLLADIARVSGHLGQPLAVSEFGTAVSLLFEAPSPPALRSALYDLVSRLPGVRVVSDSRDLIGRTAAEVYIRLEAQDNSGEALFFDPSTSAVLGVADLGGRKLQCPPEWEDAVLATGYVGSKFQLPPGAPASLRPVSWPRSAPGCPSTASLQPAPTPGS
jgi:hypothetical protein